MKTLKSTATGVNYYKNPRDSQQAAYLGVLLSGLPLRTFGSDRSVDLLIEHGTLSGDVGNAQISKTI